MEFNSLFLSISNLSLYVEHLVFGSIGGFQLYKSANLTVENIDAPGARLVIFLRTFSILNFSKLSLHYLQIISLTHDINLSTIQVSESILGSFSGTSRSISLYDCNFTGPVSLYAQNTLIDRSSFNFIQTNQNILTIDSFLWDYSNHIVFNNTFLNNSLTDPAICESVISFLFSLSSTNNYVTFSKNYFKCNYIGNTTVAQVLPSTLTIRNHLVISDNIIDPACPYLCLPGSEPLYNGIAGCVACANGWISPGGTSPCTCPPGSSTSQNHTKCILNCGFFTTIESDCKDLSTNGIIVVAVCVVILFVIIVGLLVCFRKNKREYNKLN